MISKRLAKLEATLAPPAEAAPVDMAPVRTQLAVLTIGARHALMTTGKLHPRWNVLEAFASALGVSVGRVASSKRCTEPLADPAEWVDADSVACEVVRLFFVNEYHHRLRGIGVRVEARLCRVRPLQAV
jgi:hypothetical protein